MMDNITNFTVLFLKSFLIYYKVSENQFFFWFFIVIMVNLEGAGIKHPPPVAQDAFERVWLVGLINHRDAKNRLLANY